MPVTLPEGYSWRRATPADAEEIFTLITRYNTEVLGFGDSTLDEVRADLIEPGFDLATDSWLVHEPGGTLTGFGWAVGKGDGKETDVDVISRDPSVIPWLFDQVLARAAELARAGGHATGLADKGTYRDDTMMREAMTAAGFRSSTVFHRMRADHDGAMPEPTAPPGVTLRTGPGDDEFLRTAHTVLNDSFADHYGWFAKSFADWRQTLEQDSTFDWSMLTLAELDGTPAGVLIVTDQFVADEKCGYVADLGVLSAARGRGIAKFLLRTAFRNDRAAGRSGTLLHVDTNNTTPALGLYESVGMRPVLVIDVWRREV
ncbi:bifunctional aminotransferase class I/II-fold pyridoxal phosphate-dependent enzyme/GNAT family N-acetyltransferase [Actinophytocola sp.]|uniref:GNAT family N-acetyltransferase n=1 Tax=Actinophytocola sp. TaxID=1872138 RepID=UPI002ED34105